MSEHDFRVPDEHELVEFFGREAVERAVEDGYWCYEVLTGDDVVFRFSLNLYERSVQTEHRINGSAVVTVGHECATRLLIDNKQLRCAFTGAESRTTLSIDGAQSFKVTWSTLRTK